MLRAAQGRHLKSLPAHFKMKRLFGQSVGALRVSAYCKILKTLLCKTIGIIEGPSNVLNRGGLLTIRHRGRRSLRRGISIWPVSAMGHPRPMRSKPREHVCPLHSESGQKGGRFAMSAWCHAWTAPSWQGKSSRRTAGRRSHVFGLLARRAGPLTIVPLRIRSRSKART